MTPIRTEQNSQENLKPLRFVAVTSHPQILEGLFSDGVVSRARTRELINIQYVNPRQFASGVHSAIDDRVFGGGDGMLATPEILHQSIQAGRTILGEGARVVHLAPQGEIWSQKKARQWIDDVQTRGLCLICSRYAGADVRALKVNQVESISIGNFILSGGELAAAVIVDSLTRLHPLALGNAVSSAKDSFETSLDQLPLVEADQFTRPRAWMGLEVPQCLVSGDPKRVQSFQRLSSLNNSLRFYRVNQQVTEYNQLQFWIECHRDQLRSQIARVDQQDVAQWLTELIQELNKGDSK